MLYRYYFNVTTQESDISLAGLRRPTQLIHLQPNWTRGKKKKKQTKINSMRNERGNTTTDSAEMKRIIREY